MDRIVSAAALAFVALLFVAGPALAQPPAARGGGPPFCANGNGHPVHGWSWCVAKGWASAPAYGYPAPVRGWNMYSWDDARFRHQRPVQYDRRLDRRDLAHMLGDRVLRRLESHTERRDRRSDLRGRWVQDAAFEGLALQVMMGSTTVAFLQDLQRDGRVDRVYTRPR